MYAMHSVVVKSSRLFIHYPTESLLRGWRHLCSLGSNSSEGLTSFMLLGVELRTVKQNTFKENVSLHINYLFYPKNFYLSIKISDDLS